MSKLCHAKRLSLGKRLLALALCLVPITELSAQTVLPTGVIKSTASGLWSSSSTWVRISPVGGPALPVAGDKVVVRPLHSVTLDTNSGIQDLAHLIVRGRFVADDLNDYVLGASRIDVGPRISGFMRPQFEVGTPTAPYQHNFTINLKHSYLNSTHSNPLPADENKTFLVAGDSRLNLHGRNTGATGVARQNWVRLQDEGSLAAGSTDMITDQPTGWNAGDEVLIVSTDFDMDQAEVVTLNAADGTGHRWTTPLAVKHHGEIEVGGVDCRAEVGLLSHNILIQGSAVPVPTLVNGVHNDYRRGGHMMFVDSAPTETPRIQMENVELTNMGWFGKHARYPIHFHLMGDASTSYVKNCSVHHCHQRAITLHGTNNVEVSNNVAYDTYGHMYYLEDGTEVGNTFIRNLGAVARKPELPDPAAFVNADDFLWGADLNTGGPFFHRFDGGPSVFWVSNYDNEFTDNAAAGGEFGFWIHAGDPLVFFVPSEEPPLNFSGNTAHSNSLDGLFNDFWKRPYVTDPSLPNKYDGVAEFFDFTAYKCRRSGIWFRTFGQARFVNARIADCELGVYLASEGFQEDYQTYLPPGESIHNFSMTGAPGLSTQTLETSVVVGESNNLGTPLTVEELNWPGGGRSLPRPTLPFAARKGISLYDGQFSIVDTRFINFKDVDVTTPQTYKTDFPLSPTSEQLEFDYRAAMAISSYSLHSLQFPGNPWGVDPRNYVNGCIFENVDHPFLAPIPHEWAATVKDLIVGGTTYQTVTGNSPNGVASAIIFDVDGCIPPAFSPNTYYVNDTPLLRPAGYPASEVAWPLTNYLHPLAVGGPGTNQDDSYAQLQVDLVIADIGFAAVAGTAAMAVESVTRGGGLTAVFDSVSGFAGDRPERSYPITLLMSNPTSATIEHYKLSFPGSLTPNALTAMKIKTRFSEAGRSMLLEIDYPAGAPTPVVTISTPHSSTSTIATSANSMGDVVSSIGDEYHHDTNKNVIYIKPTLFGPTPSAIHPIFDGREVVIDIN